MARIRLDGIRKVYDGTAAAAVEGLDLDIADGEFFVLLGPSGCGKSTLLKLIAGLEDPTAGRLYLDDELVNFTSPTRRNVAMVFQSYALYPQMSVRQNIQFPLRMRGVRRVERAGRALAGARTLDPAPLLERSRAHLS